MAAIHFFTEPSKLKAQPFSDAYGPVDDYLTTKYRTTLKGFLNADAKAIAICQCKVYLQPGASANLLNAVLVPVIPMHIDNGFTPVKYFIYRGLKKSDILDGNNEIIAEDPTNIGLVAKLWTNFNTLVADKASSTEPITATKPNAKALGWQYASNPTTDLMEKIIYETDDDHEVISVAGGTEIGEFVSGNEGFEIVLAERMYLPDLTNIRAAETIITATAPSGNDIPGNEPIANMRKREKILNYIDPVAWYNLFHDVGVYDYGNSTSIKGFSNIYNTFLQKFKTANTLYIDIRNENGYSLNYYKDNEGDTSDADYGMHLQLEVNGANQSGIEYYTDYWPILTTTIPINTTSDFNTLRIKFRKLYNPQPLIYADFAHEQSGNKLDGMSEHNKFKEEGNLASPTADWSEDFVFEVPNLSSIGSAPTQIAWVMKLMNIRLENPTAVSLPNTVLQKDTFLDNVFGPVNYLPDFAGSGTTQWISGLGKKYINGENKTGIKGIYSIGIGYSPTVGTVEGDVVFFADLLDEHLDFPSIQEKKFNLPTYSGISLDSNFANYIYQNETKVKGLEFLKRELRGSTFNILEQKPTNGESTVGTNLYLQMTKTEYDNLSKAGLDTNVHEPMIKFDGINNDVDLDNVPYRRAPLKVNGFNSSGNSFEVNGGFDALTFNYDTLSTETKSDVANVNEQGDGILTIDEFIEALKVVEDIYPNKNLNPKDNPAIHDYVTLTCTRVRVHYYGQLRHIPSSEFLGSRFLGKLKEEFTDIVFEYSIPNASYEPKHVPKELWVNTIYRRIMHKENFTSSVQQKAYIDLTTSANENGINDNPSPYLNIDSNLIDLGQILYGFESVHYQPHEPISSLFPPPSDTYSPIYSNFPIYITNDLAGWLANLATSVAEFFYQEKEGSPPPSSSMPNNSTLLDYYNASFPDADKFGNVDSIGIYWAYLTLKSNSNNTDLKLSDVFTLYYKGVSFLRSEIGLPIIFPKPFYTSSNRWKIFSLFYGFMESNGSGGYNWVPDDSTKFTILKGLNSNNSKGREYDKRMFDFTKFWISRLYDELYIAPFMLLDKPIWNMFITNPRTVNDNFNSGGTSEKVWIENQLNDLFVNDFLPELKSNSI